MVPINPIFEFEDHADYPEIQKDLDHRYSNDENDSSGKHTGNYMFSTILQYLTTHRKSTCKEMAEMYHRNSRYSQKAIQNNVRDFINKNLISYHIVEKDDVKKIKNKKLQTYSLTHFGILYTIHYFSVGIDFEYKLDTIRNIATEYVDYFPKIFGRFSKFKKIIGKDFEYALNLRDISNYIHELGSVGYFQDVANESVIHLDYTKQYRKKPVKEKLEDQFSYIIYNNLLENIEFYERVYDKKFTVLQNEKKQFGDWKKLTRKQLDDWHKINEKLDRVFYSLPKKAEIKWKKIIKSDPKIIKWYFWFLDNSIKINDKKTNELRKIKTILG